MSVESGNGFDRWLEKQLQNEGVKQSGPSPMPAQAQYHASYLQGGPHMSVLAKAASVVSANAVGLVVAALAVGAAGVASEAAITGSADPSNWGQQVVLQVDKCKDALTPGSHGIGECVSTFASTHGKQVSSDHRASSAREHASDARTDHQTGKPTDHPGGKPSNVPPTGHTS